MQVFVWYSEQTKGDKMAGSEGTLLKVGTRGSRLSMIQTQNALDKIAKMFPGLRFDVKTFSTVGDRDQKTDLRVSPGDFFTRELDDALRSGEIDLAVHSAKDLPDPVAPDLDWFWLPWREDPRDAWVLAKGRKMSGLPENPVVGVSSERREACCKRRFPQAQTKPVRGAIPDRLAQLDAGEFDAVLMAGAALNRLGLAERVTEWIPLSELNVPEGQGVLAVTFKLGNPVMTRLRSFFVKAVRFVGAGVGSAETCTWGGIQDLRHADVCLYDILMDKALTGFLPEGAQKVFVGKRCGAHSMEQSEITALIAQYVRQGKRVVRLKGGDPGLFGRLAEETDELDRLGIPYRVRPGVSALTVATTATGMLLTRRGESRGFTALTPRAEGGMVAGVSREVRERMPLVLFMSVRVAGDVAAQLLAEGWEAETPAAIVFDAGADDERVERATLGCLRNVTDDAPGLLVIGPPAAHGFRRDAGALRGHRVLLTCSEALRDKAVTAVTDLGGVPLDRPMIQLVPREEARKALERIGGCDWVVLTSPSASKIFLGLLRESKADARKLPRVMTCGPGTAAVLREGGIIPDKAPEAEYSAEGLAAMLDEAEFAGKRVLRLRSEKAGALLADALRGKGAQVEDVVLYRNEDVRYDTLPVFDAAFFASASAVESFVRQFGVQALGGKKIVALGKPTSAALNAVGITPSCVAPSATVESAILSLAAAL
jgi:uroporphyrinogen III methyltransferase/synthase